MSAVTGVQLEEVLDDRTVEILTRRRAAMGQTHRRGWLVRRALLAADVVGLTGAFLLAEVLYAERVHRVGVLSPLTETVTFALSVPFWIVAIKLYGLYERDEERAAHSTTDDFARLFHLITVCTFVLYALSHLTRWFNPQFSKLFAFWLIAVIGTTSLRVLARACCRRHVSYLQNAIIVGAGDVGQRIARKVLGHPEFGINLVGFVDDRPMERGAGLEHLALLGSQAQLIELVELLDVERVIFAFSNDAHERSLDLIRQLGDCEVQIDVVPRFFEVLVPSADLHSIEGLVLCGLPSSKLSPSSRLVKRAVDILFSAAGLIALAPALAVIAALIKVDSRGPVLFRQIRMGRGGETFTIFKFRTMRLDAEDRKTEVAHLNKHLMPGGDARMFKIDRDPRVTRMGSILRRWSLDELPQLMNVLMGEMSLVGPRPLILEEHRHVEDWGVKRLDLRPGITGLWQVLGRDAIGFEEMVRLDYLYVANWSIAEDWRILFKTLPRICVTTS